MGTVLRGAAGEASRKQVIEALVSHLGNVNFNLKAMKRFN